MKVLTPYIFWLNYSSIRSEVNNDHCVKYYRLWEEKVKSDATRVSNEIQSHARKVEQAQESLAAAMSYCHFLSWLLQKSTTNFKLQTFTVCFRLNAQTLGSISDFYFNFKLQHLTSTLTSYYKLQTSHFNFKRQIRRQLHIITWKVSFKSQLRMSASNFKT